MKRILERTVLQKPMHASKAGEVKIDHTYLGTLGVFRMHNDWMIREIVLYEDRHPATGEDMLCIGLIGEKL